jgi:hypothetical protein
VRSEHGRAHAGYCIFGFNADVVLAWCDGCEVIGSVKLYTIAALKARKKPAQP